MNHRRILTISTASVLLTMLVLACSPSPSPPSASQSPAVGSNENWRCRNDIEVSCTDEQCAAEATDSFTPMDIYVSTSGGMSVCAYTGCWEGKGQVFDAKSFLVLIGQNLEFSTAPDAQDILLSIDRGDGVGVLKVAAFALPVLCERE